MLALIPARGGSKGLPGKNIRPLGGMPLIVHTIRAAQQARAISRVVVTTDDAGIAAVARDHGAEIPFIRPAEFASDTSPAIDTYLHACATLEHQGAPTIKELTVLLPTAPLRTAADIDAAVTLFRERGAEAVISVTPNPHPVQWARAIDDAGVLRAWLPDGDANQNRQAYRTSFMPNGAIYVFARALLERRQGYYGDHTHAYVMPKERSVDIDDCWDFLLAEAILAQTPHQPVIRRSS